MRFVSVVTAFLAVTLAIDFDYEVESGPRKLTIPTTATLEPVLDIDTTTTTPALTGAAKTRRHPSPLS